MNGETISNILGKYISYQAFINPKVFFFRVTDQDRVSNKLTLLLYKREKLIRHIFPNRNFHQTVSSDGAFQVDVINLFD